MKSKLTVTKIEVKTLKKVKKLAKKENRSVPKQLTQIVEEYSQHKM